MFYRGCPPRLAVAALVAAGPTMVNAAADLPDRVEATRIQTPPTIDGRLDEPMWREVSSITRLKQIKPGNGDPSSEPTDIRIAYDKDALYLGVHLVDRRGPKAIAATNMKQGSRLPDDDRISFLIDPAGTGRGAYRFEVNLNGVRNDMMYQAGQPQGEWTVIWDAAATLTNDGWSVELAIPFKTLPFDPKVGAWGFNISRAIRGRGEEAVWVSRNRSWGPSITGQLAGIHDVDQGVGLDVVPTLGLRSLHYAQSGSDKSEANPSLDAYYNLTPSLSASLTVNTDFSATDADDRQVNLTRFSLFFPEKRDFFLKDADLFDFGRIGGSGDPNNPLRSVTRAGRESGRPFFSRKLGLSPLGTPVDLEYGGKVSGRIGRWRVGALTVRQDEFVPATGPVIDASTLAVMRASADVLAESSVGFVATSGDPDTNVSNSLVGADFLYQNTRFAGGRTLEGEAWVQQSDSRNAVGSELAFGLGGRLLKTDGLRIGATYKQLGRAFRPALGYVSRTGVRDYGAEAGFMHVIRNAWIQQMYTGVDADVVRLVDGGLQSRIVTFRPVEIETPGRDLFKLFYASSREALLTPFTIFRNAHRSVVIPAGSHSFDDYGLDFVTGQQRRVGLRMNLRNGDFYDGTRLGFGAELSWKQSRYLFLRAAYDFNDVDLPTGKFTTRVLSAGADINFSSRLSWTNLLQYDNVSEVAGFQSRLQWIPRAGQEFNLIVNHASEDLDLDGHFRSLTTEYGARLSYTLRF